MQIIDEHVIVIFNSTEDVDCANCLADHRTATLIFLNLLINHFHGMSLLKFQLLSQFGHFTSKKCKQLRSVTAKDLLNLVDITVIFLFRNHTLHAASTTTLQVIFKA